MATVTTEPHGRKWLRRIGWVVAIWLTSVMSLGLAAFLFRQLMHAVGLST